ncbi:F-box/WD repeat-containing protein 8-like [Crotalus adamanteus]|uniref:F-box/WD repeat-containing protein 8-like n=1 Tax=Crotalus adamanteus TaxID=8729 RepID=A0AAW1ANV9_CROAD
MLQVKRATEPSHPGSEFMPNCPLLTLVNEIIAEGKVVDEEEPTWLQRRFWWRFCTCNSTQFATSASAPTVSSRPTSPMKRLPEGPASRTTTAHRRHRGIIYTYEFSTDKLVAESVLPICRSSYNEVAGYSYNIGLVVPHDNI